MNYIIFCFVLVFCQGYVGASIKLPAIAEKFKKQPMPHMTSYASSAPYEQASSDVTSTASDVSDMTTEASMPSFTTNLTFDSPSTGTRSVVTYKPSQTSKLLKGLVQRNFLQGSLKMLEDGLVVVDSLDEVQETQLHNAARYNSYHIIRYLVKKDRININQKNSQGQTALCIAVKQRAYDAFVELIELNADLNTQDITGRTALHWACDNGEFTSKQRVKVSDDMVRLLISVDRTPVVKDKKYKILSFQDQYPYTYTNLDIQDYEGNVPLHIAVACKRYAALQELADTGAMLDVQNNLGQTPLHAAVIENDARAVKILLRAGADSNAIDYEGKMPWQYATTPEVAEQFTVLG